MLSEDENLRMTQVGKGTPMGDLLRRYWHPIAAVTEFEDRSTKSVRLMGEDLVLYRDLSGTYGLVELHCAHRRADLSYGYVEETGLRCSYHGWCYDERGRCIGQPFEDFGHENTRFRDSIRLAAYPVCEKAGLLFAYLGPEPAPCCPNWELFDYQNGFKQIVFADIPCNWLQCQENSIDPVHFEWLHSNWSTRLAGELGPYAANHRKIGIDEWDYGFGYRRLVEGTDESDLGWTMPRLCILPNVFMPGGTHFEYRVPVDDFRTLSVVWDWIRVPLEAEPYSQERVPYWYAPITEPDTGRWITSHVINQDTVAWVGQGLIADRSREHLGRSDLGITMLRRQLERDMDAVQRGQDPKGLVRDPMKNSCIRWPDNRRDRLERGVPRATWLAQQRRLVQNTVRGSDEWFRFYAGQPEDIREQFAQVMGIQT